MELVRRERRVDAYERQGTSLADKELKNRLTSHRTPWGYRYVEAVKANLSGTFEITAQFFIQGSFGEQELRPGDWLAFEDDLCYVLSAEQVREEWSRPTSTAKQGPREQHFDVSLPGWVDRDSVLQWRRQEMTRNPGSFYVSIMDQILEQMRAKRG
jgi:hypothetical protein